ncbi:MAG: amidohydrolase family protein [Gemmataceae bacterium]
MTPTRREALTAGVTALSLGAAAGQPAAEVIDTHTHFYDPTRPGGVPWPGKDDRVLYRPVLPAEYRRLAAPLGVSGTVVVEASPRVEDTDWLLTLAKDDPFLLGVVGRLFPQDRDFSRNLTRLAADPKFVGIRVAAAEVRACRTDRDQFDRLKALADAGRTLDINGNHEAFTEAAWLAGRLPSLRIVVNHLGNPLIDGRAPPAEWLDALKAAAAAKTVWCKLSALADSTRRREQRAPAEAAFYRPVLDAAWAAFGADRLVFGTNWPVSDHYAPLPRVVALATEFVKGKGDAAYRKVMSTSPREAYRLPRRG